MSTPSLLDRKLLDCRVGEVPFELLDASAKRPWTLRVYDLGDHSGLSLEFTAPDGTKRSVGLEIENGAVKARLFGNSEELLATAKVGIDQVYVVPQRLGLDGVTITENEMKVGAPDPFEPTSEATTPKI